MLDSGCTQHMTGDSRMLNSINENKSNEIDSITFGDCSWPSPVIVRGVVPSSTGCQR